MIVGINHLFVKIGDFLTIFEKIYKNHKLSQFEESMIQMDGFGQNF